MKYLGLYMYVAQYLSSFKPAPLFLRTYNHLVDELAIRRLGSEQGREPVGLEINCVLPLVVLVGVVLNPILSLPLKCMYILCIIH